MTTISHTDNLLQKATASVNLTVVPGVWVRLLNNSTATNYYSTAVTDVNGAFTHSAVPGDYSLYYGLAATVVGTPTLVNAHYAVPLTAGDDAALGSLTAVLTSPYTPNTSLPAGGIIVDSFVLGSIGANPFPGHGQAIFVFDNTLAGSETLYGAAIKTGLVAGNNQAILKLEAGIQAYINDVSHDYNVGQFINNWTGGGTGLVVSNPALGDGIYVQSSDTSQANTTFPSNSINVWTGTSTLQTVDTNSGGTVTYTATGFTDTARSGTWTLNQWANRWVTVGTTYGYIASNTTTGIATLDARGWQKSSATLWEFVADVTPANGSAYNFKTTNATGVLIQRFGAGNAIRILGQPGSTASTDLIFVSQQVNGTTFRVTDFNSTTQDTLAVTSTAKTSGGFENWFHNTSTFTGTALLMNFASGSGTFTGKFLDLQVNGTSKFNVDSGGVIGSAGNVVINAAGGSSVFFQVGGGTYASIGASGYLTAQASHVTLANLSQLKSTQTTAPTVGSGGAGTSALSILANSTNISGRFQVTLTAVAPGVVAGVVTFNGAALASAPINVVCSLSAPTAGVASPPIVGADTYTTSGFTIRVYGPTTVTTGTYVINWWAIF